MLNHNDPLISIIIPCYNQGIYLEESVASALNQTYQNIEVIIVNDGSTDSFTNELLSNYNRPKTRVICTENQGLAEARNVGIKHAKGKYILPLDADDKIAPEYCQEAVEIIENDPAIGIVHCETQYFGARNSIRKDPDFSLEAMLIRNIILCCALFRKTDWEHVKGYNKNMIYGGEDWDFWLSLIEIGKKVYKIPKIRFYYRIRSGSMARSIGNENFFKLRQQVFHNHIVLYNQHFYDPINLYHEKVKYLKRYKKVIYSTEYIIASRTLFPLLRILKKIKNYF